MVEQKWSSTIPPTYRQIDKEKHMKFVVEVDFLHRYLFMWWRHTRTNAHTHETPAVRREDGGEGWEEAAGGSVI